LTANRPALLLLAALFVLPAAALADDALALQRVLPSDPLLPPATLRGVPSTAHAPPDLGQLRERRDQAPRPSGIPEQKLEGMRMAAVSYGIRGGLAWRTWEIDKTLERQADHLSAIYNFTLLILPLPGGGSVIPPVVEEGEQAMTISSDGSGMSSSKKVLRIVRPAHMSPSVPDWRVYLVRYWPDPEPPRAELMPDSDEEKQAWDRWVGDGWTIGVRQANDIFRDDLGRLTRDIVGMALYHRLVAQGVVHELYVDQHDRGITGGGDTLRIGERAVRITAPATLNARSAEWQPILLETP